MDRPGHRGRAGAARPRDSARISGCLHQRRHVDRVSIGKPGAGTGDRTHPDPLVDREAAGFDYAVLQRPTLVLTVLKIKVAEIHLPLDQSAERAFDVPAVDP